MVAIVCVAVGLRVQTLQAGRPYTAYVDETFVLKPSAHQIALHTWEQGSDARSYDYPAFVIDATTVTAIVISEIRGDRGSLDAGARATIASPYIEVIEPWTLVFAGRLVVFALGVALVLFVALLGFELAGRRVGLLAALFVAVLPMFVTRSSIVIVDTAAACFATAALYCAARMRTMPWKRRLMKWALLGGTASALAFTSKYSAGAVLLSVLVVAAFRRDCAVSERLKVGAAAISVFVVTSLLVMPTLILRMSTVLDSLHNQTRVYKFAVPGSKDYFAQLWQAKEVGRLVLLLGLVGIVLLLLSARARPVTIGYLVFAVPPVILLSHYAFQPVRDMLPFVPFLAIGAATTIVELTRFIGRRVRAPSVVLVTIAVVVAIACCAAPFDKGTRPYVSRARRLVDTRTNAKRLLLALVQPGDRVLVARELAFLPSELRGICGHVVVSSQRSAAPVSGYDWVITGDLDASRSPTPWAQALGDRLAPLVIGNYPMSGVSSRFGVRNNLTGIWHNSRERVYVFLPADALTRPKRTEPCTATH